MATSGPPAVVTSLATLSDLARLRVLRLLDREELSVGELARALQLPQSTVSRHLKVLHDGDWVRKRVEGTASFYRMLPQALGEGDRRLWELARAQLGTTPTLEEDDARLAGVLAERMTDSRSFFGRVGGEWDQLRQELFGAHCTPDALLASIPSDWVVADLGCGTGNATERLAPYVEKVIAVDREASMLDAARKRLTGLDNVEFREGDLLDLPIADGETDLCLVLLVLHHLEDPGAAIAESARALRAGGATLIVDMVHHDRDVFRHTMGHRHLGFTAEDVGGWAEASGLTVDRLQRLRPDTEAKGPGLFTARLRKA